MLPPPCFTVGVVPGCVQTWCLAFRPKSFIRPENLVSHGLLSNSKQAIMCLLLRTDFCLATVLWRPDWCSAAEMVINLKGFSISTEELWSSGALELCQSDHLVLGHLPDQGPSPPIAQLGRVTSSWKSLGSSKILPFTRRPLCSWGPSMLLKCFGTLTQICPSTQSCLGALPVSELLIWQVCALPNHVQSIEFTIGGLQSRSSQGWSMETGCIWAQFRVS
jgi:hypothetical protein